MRASNDYCLLMANHNVGTTNILGLVAEGQIQRRLFFENLSIRFPDLCINKVLNNLKHIVTMICGN